MSKKHATVKTFIYACSSLFVALYLPNSLANTQAVNANTTTTKMVNFLAGSASYQAEKAYMGVEPNAWYPLSYVSDATNPKDGAKFWGEYVCQGQCAVHDVEVGENYHLWPDDPTSVAGSLQFERLDAVTGTNIYDAATAQIALALAANQAGMDKTGLLAKANKITDRVANPDVKNTNKAISPAFSYGDLTENAFGKKNPIRTPQFALDFRMVGKSFLTQDAFMQTDYKNLISTTLLGTSDAKVGDISWVDWKPIMGENAWGNLIGPVQTAYLEAKANGQTFVNFNNKGIQNAMNVLFAMQRMQSPIGALYYAPKGTYGNAGNELVPDGEISTENNASALAGLRLLRGVLTTTLANQSDLTADQKGQIGRAINLINIMIYGGKGPAGLETKGLLNYFKNYAWSQSRGHFVQGGIYSLKDKTFTPNDPDHSDPNHPFVDAVDVNTWGLASVGPQFLDTEKGQGASFKMLKDVFEWGGYKDASGTLIGVGFSSGDKGTVMSSEWTIGAINALAIAIDFYQGAGKGYISADDLAYLQTTKANMTKGVTLLRSDNYPTANFKDAKVGYPKLPANELGVVYASKRYYIPFGWYANPILNTAATSWNVMLDYKYNPFALGGAYNDYKNYSKQPQYDATDPSGPWSSTAPIHVTVQNGIQDTINANLENVPNTFKQINKDPIPAGGSMQLEIPVGTYALGINYGPNKWGACTLTEDQLVSLKEGSTIVGSLKPDQGSCEVK